MKKITLILLVLVVIIGCKQQPKPELGINNKQPKSVQLLPHTPTGEETGTDDPNNRLERFTFDEVEIIIDTNINGIEVNIINGDVAWVSEIDNMYLIHYSPRAKTICDSSYEIIDNIKIKTYCK